MAECRYTITRLEAHDETLQNIEVHTLGVWVKYRLHRAGRRWVAIGGSYDPVLRTNNYKLQRWQ